MLVTLENNFLCRDHGHSLLWHCDVTLHPPEPVTGHTDYCSADIPYHRFYLWYLPLFLLMVFTVFCCGIYCCFLAVVFTVFSISNLDDLVGHFLS